MRTRAILPLLMVVLVASALPAGASSDPLRSSQWGMDRIDAEEAWAHSRGDGATIAVIDTGVDAAHEDLVGRVTQGYDFVDGDADSSDERGHGTFVAGIAAASSGNGLGIAGVAPEADVLPVRALDAQGNGSSSDITRAVRFAAAQGVEVINLSLGGGLPASSLVPVLDDGVSEAFARGSLVVAAAGNESADMCSNPAFSPFALCVGALDEAGGIADFSNRGLVVDVVAPGVRIWSTAYVPGRHDAYGRGKGTSFAAPFVSGVGALLMSLGATNAEAVQAIRCSARDLGAPGWDATFGFGLLDADAAVEAYLSDGHLTGHC